MHEENSFFEKAWYLLCFGALGAMYFVCAIAEGVWGLIKAPFKK